ncbi:MAG TPA: substrate-binding domain-containing protein, partial [Rhodoferax sp.]
MNKIVGVIRAQCGCWLSLTASPLRSCLCIFVVFFGPAIAFAQGAGSTSVAPTPVSMADMRKNVAAASGRALSWEGPQSGPAGAEGKTLAVISDDLRNGGILGVAQGIQEATKVLKWSVKIFDAGGTATGRNKASQDALASHPDGLVVVGADAQVMQPLLVPFATQGIPVVGWHVSPQAGRVANSVVATNVST